MKTKLRLLFAASLATALFIISCGEGETTGDDKQTDTTANTISNTPAVSLHGLEEVNEFPNAALSIGKVNATPSGDSIKISFAFNVKNYDLKNQTTDSLSKLCNNSAQGQHIHFILDNKPYVALYEPMHETTVAKNSEHYMLAFLSRSYHLSLKNKGVAVVYHFKIDENGKLEKLDDPATPMIFYSRPKGDYLGKDTENILLDFYVWNVTLGNQYSVKADISTGGKDTTFIITDWRPYFLKNLSMGKSTIKLMLLDQDGRKVDGPHTEVSREINLAQDEPMR